GFQTGVDITTGGSSYEVFDAEIGQDGNLKMAFFHTDADPIPAPDSVGHLFFRIELPGESDWVIFDGDQTQTVIVDGSEVAYPDYCDLRPQKAVLVGWTFKYTIAGLSFTSYIKRVLARTRGELIELDSLNVLADITQPNGTGDSS